MSKIRLAILSLFLLLDCPGVSAQNEEPETIESLSQQKEILDSLLDIKQSAVDQLYLIDEQLSLTSDLIGKLEKKQRSTQNQLGGLAQDIDSSKARLEQMKLRLAENLRNFYTSYHPSPSFIFAAGDIQKAARQLHYFKATVNFIKIQIDSINQIKSELENGQTRLIDMRTQTERLVQRKNVEESLLEMRRKEKSRLLERIDADLNLRSQYLEQARRDQENLADLTGQLQTVSRLADFETLKGQLLWPVKGKIIRHFGREIDKPTNTETYFPGVQIRIPAGSQVQAAEAGTIAHAGYLRGYGNMVIVDHGGGWYTLYGHLSQITLTVGDKVNRGDVIGFSGESGSNSGPMLFFGVRKRDQSFDPVEWLM